MQHRHIGLRVCAITKTLREVDGIDPGSPAIRREINVHVAGVINLSGCGGGVLSPETLLDYLRPRLFDPLPPEQRREVAFLTNQPEVRAQAMALMAEKSAGGSVSASPA